MNQELQAYYESRIALFGSQGWRDLMADVEDMRQSTDTLNGVSDEKVLHFKKGELSMMHWLLSIESVSRETYDDLKKEDHARPE